MAIARAVPTANPDSSAIATPSRKGTYGEAYVLSMGAKASFLADEGSYYLVNTTTPGTGVAGQVAPVQANLSTKPVILLYNAGVKNVTIDYIKVRMTAIGSGATTTDFDVWIDQAGASRYTSGGAAVTPVNCNSGSANASASLVYYGVILTTAAVNAKQVGHSRVRSVVPVVEDQYLFTFGQGVNVPNAGLPTTGTNQLVAVVPMAPVVIAPGGNFLFVEWGASQTGAHSFDMELAYWER